MSKSMIIGLFLALSLLVISDFLGQHTFAQQPAPGFVSIPDDINCSVQGMSYESRVGAGGQLVNTSGSATGVTCWMSKNPKVKKPVPLTSTKITDGMLPTKEFGNLQITPVNSITSNGLYMAIGSDKVDSLREYLQK
jgi:hypothetical protein